MRLVQRAGRRWRATCRPPGARSKNVCLRAIGRRRMRLRRPRSAITADRTDKDLAWYFSALDRRDRLVAIWDRFFADFDALLMPPAMTAAFPHCEPGAPLNVDGKVRPYFGQGSVLAMGTLAGGPALVAPAGQDDEVCRWACRLSDRGGLKCVCWTSAAHWNPCTLCPGSGRHLSEVARPISRSPRWSRSANRTLTAQTLIRFSQLCITKSRRSRE